MRVFYSTVFALSTVLVVQNPTGASGISFPGNRNNEIISEYKKGKARKSENAAGDATDSASAAAKTEEVQADEPKSLHLSNYLRGGANAQAEESARVSSAGDSPASRAEESAVFNYAQGKGQVPSGTYGNAQAENYPAYETQGAYGNYRAEEGYTPYETRYEQYGSAQNYGAYDGSRGRYSEEAGTGTGSYQNGRQYSEYDNREYTGRYNENAVYGQGQYGVGSADRTNEYGSPGQGRAQYYGNNGHNRRVLAATNHRRTQYNRAGRYGEASSTRYRGNRYQAHVARYGQRY